MPTAKSTKFVSGSNHPRATSKFLKEVIERKRLFQPKFLAGLERALKEVAAGKTKTVGTFDDFSGVKEL